MHTASAFLLLGRVCSVVQSELSQCKDTKNPSMRDDFLKFIPLGGIFLVMPLSMHTAFFVAGVVGRCRHQLEARGAVGDLFEQPFCISKDCCGVPQNCKI